MQRLNFGFAHLRSPALCCAQRGTSVNSGMLREGRWSTLAPGARLPRMQVPGSAGETGGGRKGQNHKGLTPFDRLGVNSCRWAAR